MLKKTALIVFSFLLCALVQAKCLPRDSNAELVKHKADALFMLLSNHQKCPKNVFEFREIVKSAGLNILTTMVSNRSFHNQGSGSFSLFEMLEGNIYGGQKVEAQEFFFGHFTTAGPKSTIFADQSPRGLMLELIVWDYEDELYNFYELIGDGEKGQWIYRGNSIDIIKDNENLKRQKDPLNPSFGQRLRCSGCHASGGPIMKELKFPYDSWWKESRQFDFGGLRPTGELKAMVSNIVDASILAEATKAGIRRLQESNTMQKYFLEDRELSELLRPLFATMEINLESDQSPLSATNKFMKLPVSFLVNPIFVASPFSMELKVKKEDYLRALTHLGAKFPESSNIDADHGFLVPVKSMAGQRAIHSLLERGLVSKKLAMAVLAVDMTNPIFSKKRAALLSLVPESWSKDWEADFISKLQSFTAKDPILTGAVTELLENLAMDIQAIKKRAQNFITKMQTKLQNPVYVEEFIKWIAQKRLELSEDEISKNPLGEILEPGFRVVFPEIQTPPKAGSLTIREIDCEIVLNKR